MSALIKTGLVAAATLLTALSACETLPPSKGALAILSNPSTKTTAEITAVVSNALHGIKTTLASDALTKSATLIIERPFNPMTDGRRTDKPDHFTLSLSGKTCVLTHEETDTHYVLKHAKCAVLG